MRSYQIRTDTGSPSSLPSAPNPRLGANEIVRVQGEKNGNPKNSLGHVEGKRFGGAQTEIVTLRQSCCDASTTMHEMGKTNFELDLLNQPQFIGQSNNHSTYCPRLVISLSGFPTVIKQRPGTINYLCSLLHLECFSFILKSQSMI